MHTPPAEEAAKQPAPTLDFEQLFTEEIHPVKDEDEAENVAREPTLPAVPAPADDPSGRKVEGGGYREWDDEERPSASNGNEEFHQESIPEVSEPPEGLPLIVPSSRNDPENDVSGEPETSLPENLNRSTEATDMDAWELTFEYLKLRQMEKKTRDELESVRLKLNCLFDSLASDTLETRMGTIRRVRESGGISNWVLTTAD